MASNDDPRCAQPTDCRRRTGLYGLCKQCCSSWTENDDAELRRLLVEQHWTMGQVAKALGRSRNAIAGRAHRKGWMSGNSKGSRPQRQAKPKPLKVFRPAPDKPLPRPIAKRDEVGRVRLLDHMEGQCRWVVGPIFGADTMYCGAPAVTDSWCRHHIDVVLGVNLRPAERDLIDIAQDEIALVNMAFEPNKPGRPRWKRQLGTMRAIQARYANSSLAIGAEVHDQRRAEPGEAE